MTPGTVWLQVGRKRPDSFPVSPTGHPAEDTHQASNDQEQGRYLADAVTTEETIRDHESVKVYIYCK